MNPFKKIKPSRELWLFVFVLTLVLAFASSWLIPNIWISELIVLAGGWALLKIYLAVDRAEKEEFLDMVRKCNWESKNEDGKDK